MNTDTSRLGSNSQKRYGTSAMSSPDMNAILGEDIVKVKFNRSSSVGPGMKGSTLNAMDRNRRALYVNLPFLSVYGMQYRERSIARSLSKMGISDMAEMSEKATLLESVDVDEVIMTWPLMSAVLVAVLLQFLVGYNISVMNAPELVVFPGHTTTEWSLAVSVFAIGGPFGAVLAGRVSNTSGRRAAIVLNAWIFLAGGLLLTLSPSVRWLIPARVVIGFASGFATVIVPIYLGELAPPTLRGTLGTLTQFAMVIGILGSNLMAFPLATKEGWRLLFAVTPALAVVQLLCLPLIFESPRWLLNRDPYSMEARVVIKRLRGFRSDEDLQIEIDHILEASSAQKTQHTSAHSRGAVKDLLTDPSVRILVVSFVILHMAQQLSGINAIFYYSNSFFDGIIDNPLVGTTLVGAVNVIATYVALHLMDRAGRVTLILWSSGGMLVCAALVTLTLMEIFPSIIAVVGVMGFVSFFEIGLGPIPWLIVAEMFDAKYVSTAMSVACQINWASNFVVGISWPSINATLGVWSFMPFSIVLLITFVFTWKYQPETAGKTVAELHWQINNGTGGKDTAETAVPPVQFLVVEGVDLSMN
ncbi:unnamed protein product [Discosporangium mesarthrocarpum]